MIIVMKKLILIPILLSTFFLVGCESELDRCMEANIGGDFDEMKYIEKQNKGYIDGESITWANIEKRSIIMNINTIDAEEFRLSLNLREAKFDSCWKEEILEEGYSTLYLDPFFMQNRFFSLVLKSMTEQGIARKKRILSAEFEDIWDFCLKEASLKEVKTKAKKICNSQGIY